MKKSLLNDLVLLVITIIPFIYLLIIWNEIPKVIPLHWNFKGEIDNYGPKSILFLLIPGIPLFVHLLFLLMPFADPKGKISQMGNKYMRIKFITVGLMALVATYITAISTALLDFSIHTITLILSVVFMAFGNYFKVIKPNYFLGIRTPWTLENEIVWKKTHELGGKLWFFGGMILIAFYFLLPANWVLPLFATVTIFITLTPVLYSYLYYRKHSS